MGNRPHPYAQLMPRKQIGLCGLLQGSVFGIVFRIHLPGSEDSSDCLFIIAFRKGVVEKRGEPEDIAVPAHKCCIPLKQKPAFTKKVPILIIGKKGLQKALRFVDRIHAVFIHQLFPLRNMNVHHGFAGIKGQMGIIQSFVIAGVELVLESADPEKFPPDMSSKSF